MAERMGDSFAVEFNTAHFTTDRAERLAGKFARETIGSSRKKDQEAKPVGANTLNHELAYMRAMFNELERLGEWEGGNPLDKVRVLKFDETEMAYLEKEQILPLLDDLGNACTATYLCQSLHDEWRGHHHVAACLGACIAGDDVCAFQSWAFGGGGHVESVDRGAVCQDGEAGSVGVYL